MLSLEAEKGSFYPGETFNIAGDEVFKLTEVVEMMLKFSTRKDIKISLSNDRLRPIDADYQMFDNSKIKSVIKWKPEIKVENMFRDLLDYWRHQILEGRVPLNR